MAFDLCRLMKPFLIAKELIGIDVKVNRDPLTGGVCYMESPLEFSSRKDKELALVLCSKQSQFLRERLSDIEKVNENLTRKLSKQFSASSRTSKNRCSPAPRSSRSALINHYINVYEDIDSRPDHGHASAHLTLAWHNSYKNIHKQKKLAQAHEQLKSSCEPVRTQCGPGIITPVEGSGKYRVMSFTTEPYSGKSYTTSGHPLRQMTSANDFSDGSSMTGSSGSHYEDFDISQSSEFSGSEYYDAGMYSDSFSYVESAKQPNYSLIQNVPVAKTSSGATTSKPPRGARKMWKKFKEKVKKKRYMVH